MRSAGPEVTGERVARNSLVNLVASVAGLAVSFALVPVMVSGLGTQAFGVWALALTLTVSSGYLTLTDLGLQQSAVRLMADARRVRDPAALEELFSTTAAILFSVAVPAAIALIVLVDGLATVFSIDPELRDEAELTFQIIASQILLDLPALAPRAVLESDQRFLTIRMIDLGRTVALAAAIVIVLATDGGLVAIGVASLAGSILSYAAYLVVATRSGPGVALRPAAVRRRRARELMSFAGPMFALRILSTVYRQMDKLIIGVALSLAAVAHYEIASRAQAGMQVLMSAAGAAVLPAATMIRTERTRLRELLLRGTSYAVALYLPPIVVVLFYAEPLIVGWVGRDAEPAVPLVRLFFVWLALASFDSVVTTILTSLGRLRPMVALTTVWVACNLALSIVLVRPLGAPGVLVGTVVTYAPLVVAFTHICLRELGIGWREWARFALLPHAPALAVQSALCAVLLLPLAHVPDLAAVALALLVTCPLSVAAYARLGLPPTERSRFVETLRSMVGLRGSGPG